MIAFSVDLEYWFNSPLFKGKRQNKIVQQFIDYFLEFLDSENKKITFFVLGKLACENPDIIKKISQNGHEIGFHSFDHKQIFLKNKSIYLRECDYGKKILEDISQTPVIGHRAPVWSYDRENSWMIDVLRKSGFKYDNSFHGAGFRDFLTDITIQEDFMEIPQSVYRIGNVGIPFSGSIFFRAFSERIIEMFTKNCIKKSGYCIYYTHPWEIIIPDYKKLSDSTLFNLYNYAFSSNNKRKIENTIKKNKIHPVKDIYLKFI